MMEVKVKPKTIETESTTKEAEEVISVDNKEEKTMKILEGSSDETNQDDSKSDSSSSSSSSLEMMKKLENDKNLNQNTENTKLEEEEKNNNVYKKKTSSHVWDCGSSLYDSFELNSFKRQLDSAISASTARTMSMSHLPDRRLPPPPSEASLHSPGNKKQNSNKISRSLQRFLKSVFSRPKQNRSMSKSSSEKDRYYVVYDKSGTLTTIPESTEKEEMNSLLVRKTVSERFPASRVVGITCA